MATDGFDKKETEMVQNIAAKFGIYFGRNGDPTQEQVDFSKEAVFHIRRFLKQYNITELWEEVTLDYLSAYEKHKNFTASKVMRFLNPEKYIAMNSTTGID